MPFDFHGFDLTHPVNRIAAGRVAIAENVRAYGQGQFELRNSLSAPVVLDSSPIVLDSSVQSLARMNDTTPAGPPSGYVLISEDAAGNLYADDTIEATGFSGNPVSITPFRPNTSVQPWAYIADSSQSVVLHTKFALNDSSSTFACFGQTKMRSDGLIYKTGIKEPPLAPAVSAQNTSVMTTGVLEATAIPWTNYAGQNPNYDYGETNGPPNPGSPNPVDGTPPFIVDCSNASTITILSITGVADINGNPGATPTTPGRSTAVPTNPGHYIQVAGTGMTPATATVVTGAFTDGAGNVVAAGVAPLFVPSVVDVGEAFALASTIQVPYNAQAFQIGINSTGDTFNSNSGSFEISLEVTTDAEPPTLGTLGTLSLFYWGDSPQSGPVGSYIWKNPGDPGGGISRSTSNAVGNDTGNSFIFDATFTGGIPSTPGTGTDEIPMQWFALTPQSAVIGSAPVFPSPLTTTYPTQTVYANFNFCLYGKIFVPAADQYTFVLTSHDDVIWGIQDATFISAVASGVGEGGSIGLSGSGQTITVAQGYPLLPRQNYTSGEGGNYAQTTVVVAFAAAGVYGIELDYDYWFHNGRILLLEGSPTPGANPTIIPPLTQAVRESVQYAAKYRSSLTGAQSNPSPATTPTTTPVLASTVSVAYSPDPQVDKVDYYRMDAGLQNFTYVATGPNTNPPTAITDALTDTEAAANQQMNFDDYEPVPSIDLPQAGHCNVSGGVITTLDTPFNLRWLPGTVILIGSPTQLPYTFISRPTSTATVVIPGVPDGTDLVWNIAEPVLANQPLAYWFGPTDNINYVFAVGDPLRPGTLYWSKGSNLDSWPDTNQFDITDPSEALVNGAMSGGRAVLFSIKRGWILDANFFNALATVTGTSGSTWTAQDASISRGLFIPRCLIVQGGGKIFFRVDDGIHFSGGGIGSKSITDDDLYPLFTHEGSTPVPIVRNGITIFPPDDSQPEKQKFSQQGPYLYYDYPYHASNFPVTESASWTPDSSASAGQGIPWLDPEAAESIGMGSNQVAMIVGFSIADDVVTFETAEQQDPLVAGQDVTISGLGTGTYLNGEMLTIEPTGLSPTSFEAEFTHSNVGSTLDFGQATPTTVFAYAQNVAYTPPAGQNTIFAFPAGSQAGVTVTSGTCFGASLAPWNFVAGNGYGLGVNGCPLFMTAAEWESTAVGTPSLPGGAVIQSIVPVAMGTVFINAGGGAAFFQVFYPSNTFTFPLNGTLQQGPDLGTDLSVLSGTTFGVIITNTEDSDPGEANTFGLNVSFYGVAINYTASGQPISSTQLQTLVAGELGLNIPGTAPVTGVQVNLQTGMQYGAVATLQVQLTLDGTPVGSAKTLTVGTWATEYVLGGEGDTWGISGLVGSEVNGTNGLGVNVSGSLPINAQVNLNGLNGQVFYTVNIEGEGDATLVFDTEHMGWVWDMYDPPATIHASDQGESQQGNLVGCADGSVRLLVSSGVEEVTGTVLTPAIGGTGWMHFFQATVEYTSEEDVALSFIPADAGNGSYAPNPVILPSTGGLATKYTFKVNANKWKWLQLQFQSTDPEMKVYLEGLILDAKAWGSNAAYEPIAPFVPSGGYGGQP